MTTPPPSPAGLADPRPVFTSAAGTALDVARRVRPEQLSGPTPCADYDVGALLAHFVAVFRRVAAVARDEDPFSVPHRIADVPDHGWAEELRRAAAEVEAVWADPAVLARPLRLPFGTLPGAAALAAYISEVTTHTWDLAVATGQSPDWSPEVVALAVATIRSVLPDADRGPDVPFAPAVPVADDAPAIDRLVAWQGRDPSWRPAG